MPYPAERASSKAHLGPKGCGECGRSLPEYRGAAMRFCSALCASRARNKRRAMRRKLGLEGEPRPLSTNPESVYAREHRRKKRAAEGRPIRPRGTAKAAADGVAAFQKATQAAQVRSLVAPVPKRPELDGRGLLAPCRRCDTCGLCWKGCAVGRLAA